MTDPIHLRRRDYNLVPQVFPNGDLGYMISSGVFQVQADLPFLYPIEIKEDGYQPITEFNQYLSNYHGAKIGLYDQKNNQMHSLFFGGISQYYYENGEMIKDDRVPFTKNISRVTRYSDGTYHEFLVPKEMPNLQGASAEFIPNLNLPKFENKVIKINDINDNDFVIGHIFGGIFSLSKNPFASNTTNTSYADPTLYEVKLIRSEIADLPKIDGSNPFKMTVFPNPLENVLNIKYDLRKISSTNYFISDTSGKLIQSGKFTNEKIGDNTQVIDLSNFSANQTFILTLIFDNRFYLTEKIYKK
ncbi:T9SS type A sorting domain-containing protein [Belliella pelovolcani]|uniref:T9SS type A sorting domain-containing protein n=1 Tax=Belliella pelovolcani TaxID=529505 RepID=UPI0039195C6A